MKVLGTKPDFRPIFKKTFEMDIAGPKYCGFLVWFVTFFRFALVCAFAGICACFAPICARVCGAELLKTALARRTTPAKEKRASGFQVQFNSFGYKRRFVLRNRGGAKIMLRIRFQVNFTFNFLLPLTLLPLPVAIITTTTLTRAMIAKYDLDHDYGSCRTTAMTRLHFRGATKIPRFKSSDEYENHNSQLSQNCNNFEDRKP